MTKSQLHWCICCCLSRRSGTLVIGITDVILGILCILATTALLAQNLSEQGDLNEVELNEEKANNLRELIAGFVLIVIACGIPALVTLVTGIVAIVATSSTNPCFAAYSVALNILLVLALSGTTVFLFILGLRTSLLIVYCAATILQVYFGLGLYQFYQLRSFRLRPKGQEVTSEAGEEVKKLSSEI